MSKQYFPRHGSNNLPYALTLQAVTPAIPMPEEEELNMKFAELVVRKKRRNLAPYIANSEGFMGILNAQVRRWNHGIV